MLLPILKEPVKMYVAELPIDSLIVGAGGKEL
jgi:hypothetical protein